MSLVDELAKRFGGFWNSILLLVGVVVCMRFAGAEWKAQGLDVRLLRSLGLFLACFGLGAMFATGRVLASRFGGGYSRSSWHADLAWGMKFGFGAGVVLMFITGVLLVEDYLKPLLDLWSNTVGEIIDAIPG